MRRAEKKAHLVSVAQSLFNQHGYHAVGVDQIIAEAGVAKTTLYRHFPSKEDLIVAVLRKIDEQGRDAMREMVENQDRQSPLLATFDFFEQWFASPEFFGCPFLGAAKEYCDPASPIRQEAAVHKRLVLAYLEDLARREGYRDPRRVADDINLLHEGATAVAQITGDPRAARRAKEAAKRLLAAAERNGGQ